MNTITQLRKNQFQMVVITKCKHDLNMMQTGGGRSTVSTESNIRGIHLNQVKYNAGLTLVQLPESLKHAECCRDATGTVRLGRCVRFWSKVVLASEALGSPVRAF